MKNSVVRLIKYIGSPNPLFRHIISVYQSCNQHAPSQKAENTK